MFFHSRPRPGSYFLFANCRVSVFPPGWNKESCVKDFYLKNTVTWNMKATHWLQTSKRKELECCWKKTNASTVTSFDAKKINNTHLLAATTTEVLYASQNAGSHSFSRQKSYRLPKILRWYACGADGRSGGRCTVTQLPNFLGQVVYHIFLTMVPRYARFTSESSAMNRFNLFDTKFVFRFPLSKDTSVSLGTKPAATIALREGNELGLLAWQASVMTTTLANTVTRGMT